MQINNYTCTQQSFGMALRSNDVVNKAIKARISKPIELEKLSALIEQASKNDVVDIQLFASEGNKLSANVFTRNLSHDNPNAFTKHFSEGWFSTPVKFINKVVQYAEAQAAKIAKCCDYDEVDKVLSRMQ